MSMYMYMLCCVVLVVVEADIYFHNPRGSNNRLKEKSANRANANRLFDSQNNNRGGYNVGDATNAAHGNDENLQYNMKYFQSGPKYKTDERGRTHLTFEWTNQHGCGGMEDSDPHKQNCNLVFQYMCMDDATPATSVDYIRNGLQTTSRKHRAPRKLPETEDAMKQRKTSSVNNKLGQHEPWTWYDKCYLRNRNGGLFTADQKLKNNKLGYSSAIFTRQNPNGNQRGYECPEERDYYPYWHPTPWKDIAVLAENITMCSYYQSKSFNVQPYHECVEYWDAAQTERKHYSRWNNEKDCTANNGKWLPFHNYLEKAPAYTSKSACEGASKNNIRYKWGVPYDSADGKTSQCLVMLDKPDCLHAPWTRSNHLGNGRFGEPNNYTWILPHFPSGKTHRCALRIRYNVSTDDYDPHYTDSRHNEDVLKGRVSPVQQNPYIKVSPDQSPLRLAINTAQFGRVFQDRTHVFKLEKRPAGLDSVRIFNLNVRGKRGNIVQVYPAVEYDFFPTRLTIREQDLVHIQWTGSNTHNNGQPAGDGQAGDAGQGTGGTDRNNMVEIRSLNENFPVPFENSTMFKDARVQWVYHSNINMQPEDIAANLASSGYYQCVRTTRCKESVESKAAINPLLNNAPASYPGILLRFKRGTHSYICSRNNNFTNRSQKAAITVL